MKRVFLIILILAGTFVQAQRINYEPARQQVRIDAGMMIFGDIGKVGLTFGVAYQYDFLDHFGAGFSVNPALHHPGEAGGDAASRMGASLYLVGRFFGLKSPYDFKVIGGAYYGSSYTKKETDLGETRTGFAPMLGVGLDYRIDDWVISLDLPVWFEPNSSTYTALTLGLAYRF